MNIKVARSVTYAMTYSLTRKEIFMDEVQADGKIRTGSVGHRKN